MHGLHIPRIRVDDALLDLICTFPLLFLPTTALRNRGAAVMLDISLIIYFSLWDPRADLRAPFLRISILYNIVQSSIPAPRRSLPNLPLTAPWRSTFTFLA